MRLLRARAREHRAPGPSPAAPTPSTIDPSTDTASRRALARSTPRRQALPEEVTQAGVWLDLAVARGWGARVLGERLYTHVWPPLATVVRPDVDRARLPTHEATWQRALTAQLERPLANYRAALAALPQLPAVCPNCQAGTRPDGTEQTCEPCQAVLAAGWDLRDTVARAIVEQVPARAALTVTRPDRPTTTRRKR